MDSIFSPIDDKIRQVEPDIAKILSQVCYHVHPDIVKRIQNQNQADSDYFKKLFGDLIDAHDYLFPGSACVFPGVRRYIRAKGKKRRYNRHDYRAIIDDNVFPRHLWCYLVSGKAYSGPLWKSTGLDKFELAHIFTHKESELKFESDFFDKITPALKPYGSFTCAGNIVLLPKGMVRPTDNSKTIKPIFYKRHIDLYGESTLNGRSGFRHDLVPKWFPDLKWNEPFLLKDWESSVDNLMKYRRKRIEDILKPVRKECYKGPSPT